MKAITLLIPFLLVATNALAQIPQQVIDEIDLRVRHNHNPSIVVGLFENGQSFHYAQGWQDSTAKIAATSQTVYEIGSITKTFTGLLLAQLKVENKLQLNDSIQSFWPKPFSLVDSENQAITFKQLTTHTSGLPRLPDNLSVFSKDPYADYNRNQLLEAVKNVKVEKAGVKYVYSNFAVGLLGETLAVIKKSSYVDLIATKILQPLNLTQTHMQLKQVPQQLLAKGYNGNVEVDAWQFKSLAGAGAIRSSIEDLLSYGAAYLNQPEGDLKASMQLAMTSQYQQDGLKVGLGWHINDDGIIWHNGGTAGFRSIIMVDPIQQRVVAAITNSGLNSAEDIAAHLMNSKNPLTQHDFPVAIEPSELPEYSGEYRRQDSDKVIKVMLKDKQLYFTATLQPRQLITFIGNDTFKLKTFKVKFKFNRDTEGRIIGLDLKGWGEPQTYIKFHSKKD